MDLLRRLWSSLKPRPDPRERLFTAADEAVPANPAAVSTELKSILLPDLRSIVLSYAADIRYAWLPKADGRCRITADKAESLRIKGIWIRIGAAQSINDGRYRWRIRTEFDPTEEGKIAVGITDEPAGWSVVKFGRPNETDFLVSTVCINSLGTSTATRIHFGNYFGNNRNYGITDFSRSNDRQAVTLFEVDPERRTMTVVFRDGGSVIRSVQVVLPESPTAVWRPCVSMTGAVSATILPWPDD
jgi:hypothetical protein